MSHPTPESTLCSQSKGIGSADTSASTYDKIRTIPARLHCTSHWQDNGAAGKRSPGGASVLTRWFAGAKRRQRVPLTRRPVRRSFRDRRIGIGRDLAASPLPHHRTYGSRIRRFGRLSQGDTRTPTGVSAPGMPVVRSSQASNLPANASPDAIGPLHPRRPLLSTVQAFPPLRVVLCRLLTSAGRSGQLAPPSVLGQDTLQSSRGKLSYLPRIDAGFIKHAPTVDGGLCCRVPARPERTTPHLRFVSLAPHVRSTLPSDPTSR
jgi:hypothetical protein